LDRYARTDVTALAADEEVAEQVRRDQLIGPDQAAEHLETNGVPAAVPGHT
jgi:hypothetical protein